MQAFLFPPADVELYRIPHETVGDAEAPRVELALVIPFLKSVLGPQKWAGARCWS